MREGPNADPAFAPEWLPLNATRTATPAWSLLRGGLAHPARLGGGAEVVVRPLGQPLAGEATVGTVGFDYSGWLLEGKRSNRDHAALE